MAEDLAIRRKRLRFRSWHRGTREADLVLGAFADRYLADLSAEQVASYERLLEEQDPDLWDWLIGAAAPPAEHDNDIMHLLKQFAFRSRSA